MAYVEVVGVILIIGAILLPDSMVIASRLGKVCLKIRRPDRVSIQ